LGKIPFGQFGLRLDLAAAVFVGLEFAALGPIGREQVPNPALEQTQARSSLPDPHTRLSSPFSLSPSSRGPRSCIHPVHPQVLSATEMHRFLL